MIEVREYDDAWPLLFDSLSSTYAAALAADDVPVVAIEHVGSTAVPGLAAKPVIDIDIVVETDDVEAAGHTLERLGFQPRGELGIPQRWAFHAPEDLAGTHTYVVIAGSLALTNHLAVRDTLRADRALREEYAATKRRVAATAEDGDQYVAGKNATIQRILEAAGVSEQDRASIDATQPSTAARRPR